MPENQKSKFIPILLVLAIIAVAGWTVGIKTFSEKKQSQSSENQNRDNAAQKWEIYKNGKYNFQFKFPAWHAELSNKSTDDHIVFSDTTQYWNIDVEIKDTDLSSIDEWIKQNQDKKAVGQRFISGYPAVITKYINTEGYSSNDRVTTFIKDGKLFTMQTRIPIDELNSLLISLMFIKDGRFLYHNEKYGYEFSHSFYMNGGFLTDDEVSFGKEGESTEIMISLSAISQDKPQTLEDLMKRGDYAKEIVIDGAPAVIVYYRYNGEEMKNIRNILIIHGENCFSISFIVPRGSNEEMDKKIENLISDFKDHFKFL